MMRALESIILKLWQEIQVRFLEPGEKKRQTETKLENRKEKYSDLFSLVLYLCMQ